MSLYCNNNVSDFLVNIDEKDLSNRVFNIYNCTICNKNMCFNYTQTLRQTHVHMYTHRVGLFVLNMNVT